MKILTLQQKTHLSLLSALKIFIFSILIFVGFSLFTPEKARALSFGIDDDPVGCTGLGEDLSSGDMSSWNDDIGPSDFQIVVVDRATLIVKTTSPSKPFLKAGGTTLGEVFGSSGCVIRDGNLDDDGNPKTIWENSGSIASIDAIYYDGNYNDEIKSVEKSLGTIDPSKIETFGLTLVVRTDAGGSFSTGDYFAILDSGSWHRERGVESTDDGEPMRITNIVGKENYNIVLKAEVNGDSVRLVTVDGRHEFQQGTLNGQTIFADNLSDLSKDYIVLGSTTIDQLRTGTSLLSLEYFNDQGDSQGVINVAPAQLVQNVNESTGVSGASGASGEVVAEDNESNSCEGNSGVFGFIMCPLLGLANEGLETFDGFIYSAMTIDRTFIVGDAENQQIREVWESFRNIAYILLIPIMLVMVIGTALNFQIFDAYTVKRALPRLFAAVIFITLSFNICVLMIDVVNTIGNGVAGIIAQPWGGLGELQLTDVFSGSAEGDGNALETSASIVVLGGLAFYALSGVTVVGLLISIGLAFLSVLIIFAILALREVVIVFLVIMAPIAIVAWIFPGNDKPWKLWWETFSKLLLLYPIVIGLIVLGRGFAKTISISGQDDVLFVTTLIKIVAYIGPYFFIPKAFQLAGSAFGNLAGMVNDRSKGVFDRGRKKRAEATAEARQKNKNFSRFSDTNPFGRGMNSVLGGTGSWSGAKSMRSASTFRAARDAGQRNQGMENLKKDPTWPEIENNDAALLALADMGTAETMLDKARQNRSDALSRGELAKVKALDAEIQNREKAIALARQVGTRGTDATRRAALNQLAKTGYQFSTGEEGYTELSNIARSISGGDDGYYSNLMNEAQYHLKNAGRFDLAGINHGAGFSAEKGLDKASLYALANGKTDSIKAMGKSALDSGDPEKIAIHLAELKAMKPNATGANATEIDRQISQIESSAYLQATLSSGTGEYTQTRIQYDRDRAATDPAYASRFNSDDVRRGYRTIQREVTLAEAAAKKARTYERPDPNNIEN